MKLVLAAACILAVAPYAIAFTLPATSFGARYGFAFDQTSGRGKCDRLYRTGLTGNLKAGFLDALFGNARKDSPDANVSPPEQGVDPLLKMPLSLAYRKENRLMIRKCLHAASFLKQ
jgi:hypothetical protein